MGQQQPPENNVIIKSDPSKNCLTTGKKIVTLTGIYRYPCTCDAYINYLRDQDIGNVRTVWSGAVDDHQHVDISKKGIKTNASSKHRRIKLFIPVLIVLLLGLLTAFILLLYFFLQSIRADAGICTTKECIKSAANLLQSMDTTADPCDDFYQYACGNWDKEHPIPDTSFSIDWFNDRSSLITWDVRAFLEKNDSKSEPKVVHQSRQMYRACTDIDTLEKRSLSPLSKLLQQLGLSSVPPLLNSKTSVIETVARINRMVDKRLFIAVYVSANVLNRTENLLTVNTPGDKNTIPSHKEYEKRVEKMLRKTLRKNDLKGMKAWKDYVTLSMNYFLQYNNLSVRDYNSTVQNAANKIVDFEISITETIDNFTSADGFDVSPTIMTLGELQKLTDTAASSTKYPTKILWHRYIRTFFQGIDVKPITDQTRIAVYEIEYLKAISRLLARTPVTTLLLTLWWEVVYYLGPHTTNYMRDIRTDFIEKDIGETTATSRSLRCTSVVWELLSIAVGYSAANKEFLSTTKVKVNQMIDDVQEAFMDTIDKTKWIDQVTKSAIKEKAKSIKRNIGFPEWILDEASVDEYYEDLNISESTHLENMLGILQAGINNTLAELDSTNQYNSSNFNALEVNALYDSQENSITIPAGILRYPFFNLGLSALDYGAIGAVLGHELVHAFDVNGRKFDKNGNMKVWWTNTSIARFTEKLTCFVDKYSDYYVEIIDDWVDGNLTLAENLADNGGLLAAFLGYQNLIKKRGKEQTLPGFSGYTNEQVFFISYANLWCENWTQQSMKWAIGGVHSPNYVRVMATLSNLPQFGETWSCRPDVEMNPLKKCELW